MKHHSRTYATSLFLLVLLLLAFSLFACGAQIETASPSEDPSDTQAETLDLSTKTPADAPTEVQTDAPTDAPTYIPTDAPTSAPTSAPTEVQTVAPTEAPTVAPTEAPTTAPTTAPTAEPTREPSELASTGAVYADADIFGTSETATYALTEKALQEGALYDFAVGTAEITDAVKLYGLCPTVNGERVFALIDETPELSQKAASALAALCEDVYRQTGKRVHVRTEKHMDASYVGYADYQSKKSVRIGYYDAEAKKYVAFDRAEIEDFADYVRDVAWKYGFADLSVTGDAGHFRYVGVPHAAAMRDYGFYRLADYARFLASRPSSLKITVGDVNYYVHSFAYTGGEMSARVPSEYLSSHEFSATGYGTALLTVTVHQGGFAHALPYRAPVTADRSGQVICLDAGHGAHDPGAVWPQTSSPTYLEKEYNLAVALEAKAYLEAMGYTVVLTRADDTFLSLDERVSFAKSKGTDLFVSFHCNSTSVPDSPTAVGPQVYFNQSNSTKYLNWTTARTFGQAIDSATASHIAAGDAKPVGESGLRDGSSLRVLRDLSLPSVLLEMGFITNGGDRALFESAAWRETMGYAVALAVETLFANDYLGVK